MDYKLILGLLLMATPAWAECVTLDRSTWTQEQKNFTEAITYRMVFLAGENIAPKLTGEELCFEGSKLDLKSLLTEQAILEAYAVETAAREAEDEQARLEQDAKLAQQEALTTSLDQSVKSWDTLKVEEKDAALKAGLELILLKESLR